MQLKYTTMIKIYDDEKGKMYRDCDLSIIADGDAVCLENIKDTLHHFNQAFYFALVDTDLEGAI